MWSLEDNCNNIYCSPDVNYLYFLNGTQDSMTKKGELILNKQICPTKIPLNPVNKELHAGYFTYKFNFMMLEKLSK